MRLSLSRQTLELLVNKADLEEEARRHRAKMEKRKALQDAEVADKTIIQKGLLIVQIGRAHV